MPTAEVNNLIDAFHAEDLDENGRKRLVALLESDREAQQAFDDALCLEALLSSAHADPQAEQRAMTKLKARLASEKVSIARAGRAPVAPVAPERLKLVKRSSRASQVLRPPARTPIGAWTAVAAAVLVLFGLAFYFIYEPTSSGPKIVKNPEPSNVIFTVASGPVEVDGKIVQSVSDNAWVSVPNSGHAELKSKDGTSIKLEGGSRALLRAHGATLRSGTGQFGVKADSSAFELQTPVGKVSSSNGEFEAHLANNAKGDLELLVTIASGSAQVEVDEKTTVLNEVGATRRFGNKHPGEKKLALPPDGNFEQFVKPPELIATEMILDREKELSLTDDQKKDLQSLQEKFLVFTHIVATDSVVRELVQKQRQAMLDGDKKLEFDFKRQIKEQADRTLNGRPPVGNPMDVLTPDQRDKLDPLVREIMRDRRPPPGGPGSGGGPMHSPPHPGLPPYPSGNDRRPPPFQ